MVLLMYRSKQIIILRTPIRRARKTDLQPLRWPNRS